MPRRLVAPPDPRKWVRDVRGGLTQEAFAEALGVSRSMIAKWESGEDAPSWPNAWKLLDYANLLPNGAAPGVEGLAMANALSSMEATLIERFRLLSDDEKFNLVRKLMEDTSSQTAAPLKKG